jgi:Tfp pilus assembly protein PilF
MILYLGTIPARLRVAVALCVVAVWSGLTWHEMGYWDSDRALWGRVAEIAPSQPKAQLQLAFMYNDDGDTPKALSILNDGLRYRPNSLKLWLARAGILYGNKQFDEARTGYLKVMQLTEPPAGHPVEAGVPAHARAASANQLALLDLAAKNFVEAESYARTALSLDFNGVGFHETLSRILTAEGRLDEASAENALELRLRLAQQRTSRMSTHP